MVGHSPSLPIHLGKYFTEIRTVNIRNNKAKCLNCKNFIKFSKKANSNLVSHLKRCHTNDYNQYLLLKEKKGPPSYRSVNNFVPTRKAKKSNYYKLKQKCFTKKLSKETMEGNIDIDHINENVDEESITSILESQDYQESPVSSPLQPEMVLSPSKSPQRVPSCKLKSTELTKREVITLVNEAIKGWNHTIAENNSREDEYDVAGKKIAVDLRQMNKIQKIIAEKLISEVLFYGKAGLLTLNDMFSPQTSEQPNSCISIKEECI